jgi:hypothetical protein
MVRHVTNANHMTADFQNSIARHFAAKLGVASVQLEFREVDFGFNGSLTVLVNGSPFDIFYTAANEITFSRPA